MNRPIVVTATHILLVSLALHCVAVADDLIDSKLAKKANVILRVMLLTRGGADKYAWSEVEILKVYKNESGEKFGKTLKIAAYSYKTGIPNGKSTVYIERYNKTDNDLWKLVGGEASTGVSHVQNQ